MQGLTGNHRLRRLLFGTYAIGLLTVFYFYLWFRIRPELFYQQKPNVFLFDSYFFAAFWDKPGGPVDYASAFLSPLFAYGWLGAGLVTLLTALICLATRWFMAVVAGRGGQIVFLMPAILIVMVLGQYCHPVRLLVSLLVVLVFANAYMRIGTGQPAVRLALFAIASVFAYYVGAGLYVVFALLCGVFEWRVDRRRWLGATCVLCAAVVPATMGGWFWGLSYSAVYRGTVVPTSHYWLAMPTSMPTALTFWVALLAFFPLAAIVLSRCRHSADSTVVAPESLGPGALPAKGAYVPDHPISAVRLAVRSVALVALGVGADATAFDFPMHCLLQINCAAEQERWADVLVYVRRLPPSNSQVSDLRTSFHVNRALYFTGGLLDRMFDHAQLLNSPTLALRFDDTMKMVRMYPLECSDVLFDLGWINGSEHMTYEALELLGERPHILKRLVYINALKGEPDVARVFLARLERCLLHRQWACRVRRQLDTDPTLSAVPTVASRRELMPVEDVASNLDLETVLEQLLRRNARNQMAFEYLMAHYLLTRQLDKLVANLHRFDDFDYPRFPRHYEEALVIYLDATGLQDLDLGRRKISPETWRRYNEFVQDLGRFRWNDPAAFTALQRDFGDSYFFCHAFGYNTL